MIYFIHHLVYRYSLAWTVETGPRDVIEVNQRHSKPWGTDRQEGGSDV